MLSSLNFHPPTRLLVEKVSVAKFSFTQMIVIKYLHRYIYTMEKKSFIPAEVYNLKESINFAEGGVVSKQFIKNKGGNITFFAFDKGEGLSEHTAPFDAVVQIIEGEAEVSIDGKKNTVREGELIIMPANIAHALHAIEPFKMCLIMLKG